jgi:uncharacterized protein (TIGR00297 family)
VGVVVIGTIIFAWGGWLYALPLVFFFVSSSLLSLITSARKLSALKRIGKTGPRDIRQVLANGAVAAAVVVITSKEDYFGFLLYLLAVSAPAADTWATEIGTLSRRRPVSIVRFKKLEPGQSGGVTLIGLAAAFLGAFLTAASGLGLWYFIYENGYIFVELISITIFGVISSIIDSILGDSFQGQYRCVKCGLITEEHDHCGHKTMLVRGFRIINNDVVNFASILLTSLLYAIWLRGLPRIIVALAYP